MTTKICVKCHKEFLQRQIINGKAYNLQQRKFCLDCSPFKAHNTRDLTTEPRGYARQNGRHKPYSQWSEARKQRSIDNLQQRRTERKLIFVQQLGGKCHSCGYDKNFAALEFHHKDPTKKAFGLSVREIAAYSLAKLAKEVSKCQLLCSNCHAEHHHPQCKLVGRTGIEPVDSFL